MQFLIEKKINFKSPADEAAFENQINSSDKKSIKKALDLFTKTLPWI